MMRTIDDYMSLNYRMEIVEDKEEGRFCGFLSGTSGMYYLWGNRNLHCKCSDAKKAWVQAHWRKESRFMSQTVWKNILDSLS